MTYTTHVDKLASVLLLNLSFSTEACLSDKLLEVEVKPYVFSYGSLNTREDVLSFHVEVELLCPLVHYAKALHVTDMKACWSRVTAETNLPTIRASIP